MSYKQLSAYNKLMAKFLIVPVIIILAFASVFYVTSVKAKENNNREIQRQKLNNPITKITIVDYKIPSVVNSNKDIKPNDKSNEDRKNETAENNSQNRCYDFLANGANLKSALDVTLNFNNSNLDSSGFIVDTVTNSANEWNTKTGKNIFGKLVTGSTATVNDAQPDGKNVIAFVNNPDTNIVSTITVWGHFSNRQDNANDITEWDIALNSANIWGNATTSINIQDLQDVITHDLGHAAGLADISSKSCSKETMYNTLPIGETQKRDLAPGDIKGIQKLYK